MNILGIVTSSHDTGVALLSDGVPIFILEEERFNRQKHTQHFPSLSLSAGLNGSGIGINDIDVITTPWVVPSAEANVLQGGDRPSSCKPQRASARSEYPARQRHLHLALSAVVRTAQASKGDKAASDRRSRPSRLPCRDLFRISIRGCDRPDHGRLWGRHVDQRLYGARQPVEAPLADQLLRFPRYAVHLHDALPRIQAIRGRERDGAGGMRRSHLCGEIPRADPSRYRRTIHG